ncbi:MAG: hypothetical protein MJ252_24575 [archaeon]|nr:hypothetical protein [archaeon]
MLYAFKFYDPKKTGYATFDNFLGVVYKLGVTGFSEVDLEEIFHTFELKDDQLLDYKKFISQIYESNYYGKAEEGKAAEENNPQNKNKEEKRRIKRRMPRSSSQPKLGMKQGDMNLNEEEENLRRDLDENERRRKRDKATEYRDRYRGPQEINELEEEWREEENRKRMEREQREKELEEEYKQRKLRAQKPKVNEEEEEEEYDINNPFNEEEGPKKKYKKHKDTEYKEKYIRPSKMRRMIDEYDRQKDLQREETPEEEKRRRERPDDNSGYREIISEYKDNYGRPRRKYDFRNYEGNEENRSRRGEGEDGENYENNPNSKGMEENEGKPKKMRNTEYAENYERPDRQKRRRIGINDLEFEEPDKTYVQKVGDLGNGMRKNGWRTEYGDRFIRHRKPGTGNPYDPSENLNVPDYQDRKKPRPTQEEEDEGLDEGFGDYNAWEIQGKRRTEYKAKYIKKKRCGSVDGSRAPDYWNDENGFVNQNEYPNKKPRRRQREENNGEEKEKSYAWEDNGEGRSEYRDQYVKNNNLRANKPVFRRRHRGEE